MIELLQKSRQMLARRPSSLTMLHAISAALNLGFSLAQTLVLARSLEVRRFSELVALVAIGLFLAPVYQLVARGNYALFVDARSRSCPREMLRPASIAILLTQVLSVLASLASAALLSSPESFLPLFAFSLYINLSNSWYNEIQTSFFMFDEGVAFTYYSLARRACSYVTLGFLLYTHSFVLFCWMMGVQAVAFHVILVWSHRAADVSSILIARHIVDPRELFRHLRRSAAVLNVIGAEWVALSFPYGVFSWCFGVGVELVVLDTGLKLVRVALTFVRAFAEAALPKLTNARSASDWLFIGEERRRLVSVTLATSVPLGCVIALSGSRIFELLLGARFPLPYGVGLSFASSTVLAALLQLALFLVGFYGRAAEMRYLLLSTLGGALVMVVIVLVDPRSLALGLWAFTALLLVSTWGALRAARRALSIQTGG